jgi:hypothetical protein
MESYALVEKKFRVFFLENKFEYYYFDIFAHDKNGLDLRNHFTADKPLRICNGIPQLKPRETIQLIILDPTDEPAQIEFPLTMSIQCNGVPFKKFKITEDDHGQTFAVEPIDLSKEIKKKVNRLDEWFTEHIEAEANCHIQ